MKPGDCNVAPAAACDPLDVGNSQTKGSEKADHRMQLCMCCTATHRGASSGNPHLSLNMPTPCFSPSQSALSRNNYIFECHMRQGPLSHAEKKPLLVKFLPAGKGRAQTSASSMYTNHPCWNPGWEHRVGRHICTGKCSIDDTRVTRAPQCSQNCPWVINQLLLWVLVAGIQLDLMTAGLHETIDLACGDSFWTGLATVFITS